VISPRARQPSVRPGLLPGAFARPLSFTVRPSETRRANYTSPVAWRPSWDDSHSRDHALGSTSPHLTDQARWRLSWRASSTTLVVCSAGYIVSSHPIHSRRAAPCFCACCYWSPLGGLGVVTCWLLRIRSDDRICGHSETIGA